jgi:hypothetical protein
MHRAFRSLLLAVAAASSAACASSPDAADPEVKRSDAASGAAPAAPAAEAAPSGRKSKKASGAERAGEYALTVPQNIVYLPWKLIGGGVKGASDGVQAGFDKGRMPLFGLLFSPVNLVTGFVTGAGEGLVMPPAVVGPDDDFGRAMAGPTDRDTTIWWYP